MASLYKRATPAQRRIMRAVEGAVKNVADCHPHWQFRPEFARSIAKRAAGTLTAQWPEVLAARKSASSDRGGVSAYDRDRPQRAHVLKPAGRGPRKSGYVRSPLPALWKKIAADLWRVKRAGQTERMAALIDILKMIDEMEKGQ